MNNLPYTIGITGTIGSGKSTVGKLLAEAGVPVLDTDRIVHDLMANDGRVRKAIIERFGTSITDPDGDIDRKQLGALVFQDERSRRDLESIIHPAVILECRNKLANLSSNVAAILVPLLFETNLQSEYDEVWTVIALPDVLRARLKQRDSMTDAEIDQRLAAQLSQDKKAKMSKVVIDNSHSIESTRKQVMLHLNKVLAAKASSKR